MEQNIQEKFLAFQILPFELGVANSRNIEKDTCQPQSMCQEAPLRFHLTLGEILSKSTSVKLMQKHYKNTLMEISQVFRTLSHVDCLSVYRNRAS